MTPERLQEIRSLFTNRAYLAGGIYSMEGGIIWECLGEIKRLTRELTEARESNQIRNIEILRLSECVKQLEAENARLREALSDLDEAIAVECLNRDTEIYFRRIIKQALQIERPQPSGSIGKSKK